MECREHERIDDLQRNGYRIIQNRDRFCFGMDAVLLAEFARVKPGEQVLDLGTGTGVLPRNMYRFGADWIGTDISENQISQARRLSDEGNMEIRYLVTAAEDVDFPARTFDVVTHASASGTLIMKSWFPKLFSHVKR